MGQRREKRQQPQQGVRSDATAFEKPVAIPGAVSHKATLRIIEIVQISMISVLLCVTSHPLHLRPLKPFT